MFSGLKDTHLLMCGCVSNLETLYLDTWPTHNAPTACSGFGLKRVRMGTEEARGRMRRIASLDRCDCCEGQAEQDHGCKHFSDDATAHQLLELQDCSTVLALLRLLATTTRTERIPLSRFDCGYTLSAFVLGQLELVGKVGQGWFFRTHRFTALLTLRASRRALRWL